MKMSTSEAKATLSEMKNSGLTTVQQKLAIIKLLEDMETMEKEQSRLMAELKKHKKVRKPKKKS